MVVNALAWSAALWLGGLLMLLGVGLRVLLPAWAIVPLLPMTGAAVGWVVGAAQQRGLVELHAYADWPRASAFGGAAGAVVAGLFAVLLPFDWLLSQLMAGAWLAAGVGFGQVFWGGLTDGDAPRGLAVRWALVNALGGAVCAGVSPAGQQLWLVLSCGVGVSVFGLITGWAAVRTR